MKGVELIDKAVKNIVVRNLGSERARSNQNSARGPGDSGALFDVISQRQSSQRQSVNSQSNASGVVAIKPNEFRMGEALLVSHS